MPCVPTESVNWATSCTKNSAPNSVHFLDLSMAGRTCAQMASPQSAFSGRSVKIPWVIWKTPLFARVRFIRTRLLRLSSHHHIRLYMTENICMNVPRISNIDVSLKIVSVNPLNLIFHPQANLLSENHKILALSSPSPKDVTVTVFHSDWTYTLLLLSPEIFSWYTGDLSALSNLSI